MNRATFRALGLSDDDYDTALDEARRERSAWVRVDVLRQASTPSGRLLFCPACNLSDAIDTDGGVSVFVPGGTLCDGCGERAP